MAKILIQRRVKPYQSNGKTTFSLQGKPGVYLIYLKEKVVYVGYSGTNLYKTMYRHFQSWKDKTQTRVVYSDLTNITVRVVYTNTAGTASRLEKALIKKYNPVDNTVVYPEVKESKLIAITEDYINEPIKPIITSEEDYPF